MYMFAVYIDGDGTPYIRFTNGVWMEAVPEQMVWIDMPNSSNITGDPILNEVNEKAADDLESLLARIRRNRQMGKS